MKTLRFQPGKPVCPIAQLIDRIVRQGMKTVRD